MDSADKNLLDLSKLAPEPAKIKLPDGEIVEVQPPKVEHVMKLGFLADKLKDSDQQSENIAKIVSDMELTLVLIIPELAKFSLNAPQLLGVIELVTKMAMPAKSEILADAGIEVNAPDPKG